MCLFGATFFAKQRSVMTCSLRTANTCADTDETALVRHPVPLRNIKVFLHLRDFNLSDMHIHCATLLPTCDNWITMKHLRAVVVAHGAVKEIER